MGLRADGAAQGYTVLGGIVLLISAIGRINNGITGSGSPDALMDLVLGVVLLIITILAFDASGLVRLTLSKSGLLLALFGFIAILVVSYPGITLDIIAWLRSLETLAGFMLLLGGLIMAVNK
ncbi:MAG: hypothetical protein ACTSV3_04815 [Candidatus Thorarchaeota archaeon]|nr:MAG: hypothetical protein DRP09_11435 [Candidatus Thorarchaeota archaeon]RLI58133.1 MAG: hypothetical protein DRO87_06150 [Candidatus Thorarchaeota archaeon]